MYGDGVLKIISSIESGSNSVDGLVEELGLTASEVIARLGELELEGLLVIEGEKIRLLKNKGSNSNSLC